MEDALALIHVVIADQESLSEVDLTIVKNEIGQLLKVRSTRVHQVEQTYRSDRVAR